MGMPTPHPFQDDAVDRLAGAVRAGAKVSVLCSPTGSGKTTMGCMVTRRALLRGKRSLILAHMRRLVDQFADRLRDFDLPHGVIMDDRHRSNAPIQVASRDTLFASGERPEADVVLVDEGRHAVSPEYRRLLNHYERQNVPIILLDATPVTAEGTGLGPWAQALVVAARVTDLIRDKYLVPVKCFAPDREMRRGKARRGIAGDLVESWRRYGECRPTVLFCSRVRHSLDAVAEYNLAGVPAAHVDAETPDGERDEIFDRLGSGRLKVVSNVGIIKEGVDIPCLGCCQFYMDPRGRVRFLQGCGRIMRPFPGKDYGILIDHAGAVFTHGFPDEDTEWVLEGNVDADFARKHEGGDTEKVLYCQRCELLYHGAMHCPQCGRAPAKPPRSIFAPPPVDATNEALMEADRGGAGAFGREAKVQTWFACLAVARKRDGTFTMASRIYHNKYKEYPPDDFPCLPGWDQRRLKVGAVYPNFGRKKNA